MTVSRLRWAAIARRSRTAPSTRAVWSYAAAGSAVARTPELSTTPAMCSCNYLKSQDGCGEAAVVRAYRWASTVKGQVADPGPSTDSYGMI